MKAKDAPTYGQAPRIAIWIGLVLLVIGLMGRYVIGVRGVSSLNPLFLGMAIALLGFLALEPEYARGAMRGITALAMLGLLITLHALPLLHALLLGQPLTGDPAAVFSAAAMLLLCGALLIVCIVALGRAWYTQLRR